MKVKWSKVPTIHALQADTRPGLCPFCDAPLGIQGNGKFFIYCKALLCRRSYNNEYRQAMRLRWVAMGLTVTGKVPRPMGGPGPTFKQQAYRQLIREQH